MLFYSHRKLTRILGFRFLVNKLRDCHFHLTSTPCSSPLIFKSCRYPKRCVTYTENDIRLKSQNQIWSSRFRTNVSGLCTNAGSQPEDPESDAEKDMVSVTFVTFDGEVIKVKGKVGDNVLDLAKKHDVGVEGACDKKLACTTCHMYVDKYYEQFIEPSNDEEDDLLDTAPFLKENSRLTCQIELTKEMDGICFKLPQGTINFYVDGHKPTPH